MMFPLPGHSQCSLTVGTSTSVGVPSRAAKSARARPTSPFVDWITSNPHARLLGAPPPLLSAVSVYGSVGSASDFTTCCNLRSEATESVPWEKKILATLRPLLDSPRYRSPPAATSLRRNHMRSAPLGSVSEVLALLLIPDDRGEAEESPFRDFFAPVVAPRASWLGRHTGGLARLPRAPRLLSCASTIAAPARRPPAYTPAVRLRLAAPRKRPRPSVVRLRQSDRTVIKPALAFLPRQA